MIINPRQKLRDKLFYNNLCLIVAIFSIICLFTSMTISRPIQTKLITNVEGVTIGPIKITDKPKIYRVDAHFIGNESSKYLSGEVLDEEQDTLYEFGKDFWHESGYDSEGYWSESDRDLHAYLTFSEKGTYYIQFRTEEANMGDIQIMLSSIRRSYVIHSQIGTLALILVLLIFWFLNSQWVKEKAEVLNDMLEELSDD